jgi:hypothetical protein
MSSTTILELREKDSYKSYNAGDYSIQLAKPIKVSAGDNIILSKGFYRHKGRNRRQNTYRRRYRFDIN